MRLTRSGKTTVTSTAEQSPRETEVAGTAPPEEPAGSEVDQEKPGAAGTALAQLETIMIKGRAPKTGYDRDQFGSGWLDPDRNGCDARIICTIGEFTSNEEAGSRVEGEGAV